MGNGLPGPTRDRVAATACGLLAMLPLVSCSESSSPESSRSSPPWTVENLRGLPTTAQIADVVVRRGVWVAIGSVQSRRVAGQPFDMGLWRSSDGLSWQEAYRTRGHGDESTKGHLAVTSDGFAVVGTGCENQTCRPIALVSSDGRRWRPASTPPNGIDNQGSPQGQVSGLAGVPDASGRPGRDLVAVGSTGGSPGGEPIVWRSHDAGRTWEGGAAGLGGPGRVALLDWVVASGGRIVAHGFGKGADQLRHDVLLRSDDLGRHWVRVAVPDGVEEATKPGRPRDALFLMGRRPSGESGLWRSDDLVHWTNPTTVPDRYGSLLDTGEGLVFARSESYTDPDGRLEVWGAAPDSARFDRTYFFGPKEQPALQAMVVLAHRVHAYVAVGRPGTRGFVRLNAGIHCAVRNCPPAPAVPPDVLALTGYRAEPVPVLSSDQRVFVASDGGEGAWSDVTPERLLGSAEESVQDVVFTDRDHGWLVVVNVEQLGSRVLRTTDGGHTWTTTGYVGGFSMHAGTSLKVSAVDGNHAWTAYVVPPGSGRPHIARTTDGGRTWSGGDDSLPIADAIRFIDTRRGFSADDFGFGPRGFFVSTDGGATWKERQVPRQSDPPGRPGQPDLPGTERSGQGSYKVACLLSGCIGRDRRSTDICSWQRTGRRCCTTSGW